MQSRLREKLEIVVLICGLLPVASAETATAAPVTAPEHRWIRHYDQTLTMKATVATKKPGGGTSVHIDLEHLMTVVQKIDQLTLGMPKILYLVGWQYDGHDSKYPAFFEVNPALKRPQDATALEQPRDWSTEEFTQRFT